jgi:hypothetical protein
MIQILVVDDRTDFTKDLKLNLLRYLNVSAVIRHTPEEATEILDLIPDIKLIVTRSLIGNINTAASINNFIKTKELDVSIIAYESMETVKTLLKNIAEKLKLELSIDRVDSTAALKNAFHPVSIGYFDTLTEAPCDVYIRIGNDKASHRYVKRINQFDKIPLDLINRLKISQVYDLYIHHDYHDNFMTYLANTITDGMTNPSIDLKARMNHQAKAFYFIQQFALELKVDNRLIDVVENSINSISDSIQNYKPLNELINEVLGHKEGHLFQGAYLTNIMGLHILKQLKKNNQDDLDAMIFASLFSDLGMKRPQEYLISTEKQLKRQIEKLKWNDETARTIRHHAKRSAELLNSYPNLSMKAQKIVLEHHGSDLGIGFVPKPGDSISSLSKVFLAANTFILNFLNPDNKFNKRQIIDELAQEFEPEIVEYLNYFNRKIE